MLFRYFQDPIRETVEDFHSQQQVEVDFAGTGGLDFAKTLSAEVRSRDCFDVLLLYL